MPTIKVVKGKSTGTSLVEDPNVSTFAKGVFLLARSVALNKTQNIKKLFALMAEDRDEVYRAIMELRTQGYCKRKKIDKVTLFKIYERVTSHVKNKTFPESYSKTLAQVQVTPKQIRSPEDTQGDKEFEDWDEVDVFDDVPLISQPSFLTPRKEKTLTARDPIPGSVYATLYRMCFMVDNGNELRLLSSGDRGRVTSCLGRLQSARADLSQLNRFEDWWVKNWRSKANGQYQPPRPEQVVSHWFEAMKHSTYNPAPKTLPRPEVEIDLDALMHNKKLSRHHD